jgi:UMF1 family MFS transporter
MDKKRLFLWSMYDFANSIVLIIFYIYFSQWLTIEMGVSDFWYNFIFTASSILLLITAPVAASIADKKKIKMPGLRITTILTFVFFFITGVIVAFYPIHTVWAMVFATLAMYLYLFCFTYYHPLLSDVAPPEKRGLASGWGIFGNELGQISALLVSIPLATGAIVLFNTSLRAQTLIPAAILFLLFSLPMLVFFKEKSVKQEVEINIKSEYKGIIRSTLEMFKLPGLGRFFLAYFFFNDAIITASNNFAIYLERVFGVSDTTKSLVLVGIILVGAIGAPISGWISDRIGWKKTLMWLLVGFAVIFPALAVISNFYIFLAVVIAMGLWWGGIWSVTRAIVIDLTPEYDLNQSFTFYTLMERFSTLVGPISWGLIVAFTSQTNGLNYRIAIASMTVFILIGLYIARKLPDKKVVI